MYARLIQVGTSMTTFQATFYSGQIIQITRRTVEKYIV